MVCWLCFVANYAVLYRELSICNVYCNVMLCNVRGNYLYCDARRSYDHFSFVICENVDQCSGVRNFGIVFFVRM